MNEIFTEYQKLDALLSNQIETFREQMKRFVCLGGEIRPEYLEAYEALMHFQGIQKNLRRLKPSLELNPYLE